MKKLLFSILVLAFIISAKNSSAEPVKDFPKSFGVVTKILPVTIVNKKDEEKLIFYRFAWSNKAPYTVAVQFSNLGYADWKIKFAIKDVTAKKMVVLDKEQNSFFGTEMLKGSTTSAVWSGPVDNINDKFSIRVWLGDGDEIDKEPLSIKDKK